MPKDLSDHESGHELNNEEETTHTPLQQEQKMDEELMQKLGEAEQKANQYFERLLRMQAESENAARRMEREVANAHKYALERFVTELLPIVDSLELSISKVSEEAQIEAASIIEGVNLTLKMFYSAMEKFGIKQINPVAEAFNPEFHQAISMQTEASVKPGTVLTVLQKGYTLNHRLIRPALVVVAKENEDF